MSGRDKVFVARSAVHGRGLFAARDLAPGEEIGTYPLLVLSVDETAALKATKVYHYIFHFDETEAGTRGAVAFGEISMCNHSPEANAAFAVDAAAETVMLTARTPIPAGAEILIDYEDFAEEVVAATG